MSNDDKIHVEAQGVDTFSSGAGCAVMIIAALGGIALIIWACGVAVTP